SPLSSVNSTPTTDIYTLSLHDALPIYWDLPPSTKFSELSNFFGTTNEDSDDTNGLIPSEQINFGIDDQGNPIPDAESAPTAAEGDRKSTRLNSSHVKISYAVFCLKKKK